MAVTRDTEAPEHLTQLERHVRGAEDHQVLGELGELEQAGVVEPRDGGKAGDVGHPRPRSHVQVDALAREALVADLDRAGADERGPAAEQGDVRLALEELEQAVATRVPNLVHARHRALEVDVDAFRFARRTRQPGGLDARPWRWPPASSWACSRC